MNHRTWTSILAYTSARILMFGCAVILLYVAGARGVLLLGLGLVISALASYILLNKQRAVIADKLNAKIGKAGSKVTEFRERLEEGTHAEDTDDEDADAAGQEAVRLQSPTSQDLHSERLVASPGTRSFLLAERGAPGAAPNGHLPPKARHFIKSTKKPRSIAGMKQLRRS